MLEAIDVTKQFSSKLALDGVSLKVAPGEIFCLLGPNGAGKTTLINLFLGFAAPRSGSVRVDGLDVSEHPLEAKRALAHLPEQVALYGLLSGQENLEYFAALSGRKDIGRKASLAMLAGVGIDENAAQRRVSTYSKGMRQKVGIAIAAARDAKAFLLDEPTSGLDPKATSELSELLLRARDRGAAILVTTHDLLQARQIASRVGILRDGRLVASFETRPDQEDLDRVYLQHIFG
jgi:ABC-2 type transport system ATP-binding protein